MQIVCFFAKSVTVCARSARQRFMEKQCRMQKNSWIEKKLGLEWSFNQCYLFNKSRIRGT